MFKPMYILQLAELTTKLTPNTVEFCKANHPLSSTKFFRPTTPTFESTILNSFKTFFAKPKFMLLQSVVI
jgi:hypothetical protein